MNDMALLVEETASRLFQQEFPYPAIGALEAGSFDTLLWARFEESGFSDLLTCSAQAGKDALADAEDAANAALQLLLAAGYHHVPLPVAETLAARTLAAQAGLEPPPGISTCVEGDGNCRLLPSGEYLLNQHARRVPWARHAAWLLIIAQSGESTLAGWLRHDAPGVRIDAGANLAGEPRDDVRLEDVRLSMQPLSIAVQAHGSLALRALCSAALMAGAAEAALDLSVRYANERVQFGKPIFSFQAVQQQLAVLAGQAASARTACALAFAYPSGADWRRVAIAKIRAGAAASAATDIAHQVHGAIGITQEYPLHLLTRRLWSWRAENGADALWAERLGREVVSRGGARLWPDLVRLQPDMEPG